MRSLLWPVALLGAVIACGDGKSPPTPSPYGLDVRPTNATCVARKRPVVDTGVTLQRQWPALALQTPLYLTQAPGDNTQWYVMERQGRIRTFASDGSGLREFASLPVSAGGEGGLLGFAFHPAWPTKREAYLSYTRAVTGGDPAPPACQGSGNPFTSVIARYQSTNNGMSLNLGPDEILKVGQPYSNHNGGGIQFGNDGMLYIGLGDGGSGNDPCASGQSLSTLLGKMLRIDVNAAAGAYVIPADNPFAATAGARPEIWALGLRNPWRWSFDRAAGDLWLGDVGQGTWEEIDVIVKGGNYGWRTCEGFHRLGSTTTLCGTAGTREPVVTHGRGEARSITGGYVYRGAAMPSLVGTYIYGDYETGNIWALTYDTNNRATPKLLATVAAQTLASFAQGNDGEVYTVQTNGVLSKLVPTAPPPPDDFPQLLSQTGCFDAKDPRKPVAAMIPFEVNSPLWADAADKERYLAIPDGKTIAINAEQDWELPVGAVVAKGFSVAGKRLETRLFMRHDDGGWGGYTYEWNEQGTDATLLPAGKVKAIGAGGEAWAYPSRSQCMQCHSQAAGGTIGLETAQLNRDAVYPSTNRLSNQLATLDHIGLFSAPLPAAPSEAPRLAEPDGAEPLEARARSYLHANCAHCHRPMGGGQGTMDLRITQSLRDAKICNVDNTQGQVEGASKLLAPGAPQASVLSRRLHATDSKRMPPVGVSVADPLGQKLIDDWISSVTACP
ncbi:MAG: PQQ-dependent sugar dehydrogenase [Myxococcales bacterium]|nr:PQQ-dependent sugar dehydrogenase [Myxococcales bacterium]